MLTVAIVNDAKYSYAMQDGPLCITAALADALVRRPVITPRVSGDGLGR